MGWRLRKTKLSLHSHQGDKGGEERGGEEEDLWRQLEWHVVV